MSITAPPVVFSDAEPVCHQDPAGVEECTCDCTTWDCPCRDLDMK